MLRRSAKTMRSDRLHGRRTRQDLHRLDNGFHALAGKREGNGLVWPRNLYRLSFPRLADQARELALRLGYGICRTHRRSTYGDSRAESRWGGLCTIVSLDLPKSSK